MSRGAMYQLVCPHCGSWNEEHRVEHLLLFGTNFTVVICPAMIGWTMLYNHHGNRPLWADR